MLLHLGVFGGMEYKPTQGTSCMRESPVPPCAFLSAVALHQTGVFSLVLPEAKVWQSILAARFKTW